MAVLGAGLLGAWAVKRHGGAAPPVRIQTVVEGGPLRPDRSATPGQVWLLRFDGAELRLYRNGLRWGERCPGGSGCTTGRHPALRLPLDGPGEYRAVAYSPGPGGEGGSLHDDVSQARADGVAVALSEPLIVY